MKDFNRKETNHAHCPERRNFLKLAGIAGAGLMSLGTFGCAAKGERKTMESVPELAGRTDHVAVQALAKGVGDEEIIKAVQRVADSTTDFSWLSRGDVVFLKPVANSPNQYPATTSPLAVRAMTALLLRKGAGKVIVGDKPGVMTVYQDQDEQDGSSREVFSTIGLHSAAVEAGAEVYYFDEAGFDDYSGFRTVNKSHWKGELMLPNILNRVDHVVLLPRVSRHVLAGTTLGLKAAVGWLRDDSRLEYHRDSASFYEKTAEINDTTILRQKHRMTLSVATKVLSTFGPDEGYVSEPALGLVFGSESLLAHDMVALGWLMYNREYCTPGSEISWFNDPYTGMPSIINKWFVGYIWGVKAWYLTQSYGSTPIHSARTDPVISRAAKIWGGFPEVELEDVSRTLPEHIRKYMLAKTAE